MKKIKNNFLVFTVVFPLVFGMLLIDPVRDPVSLVAGYWIPYLAWAALFCYANFFHRSKDEKKKRREWTCIDLKSSND